jgi:hypothetical protein
MAVMSNGFKQQHEDQTANFLFTKISLSNLSI